MTECSNQLVGTKVTVNKTSIEGNITILKGHSILCFMIRDNQRTRLNLPFFDRVLLEAIGLTLFINRVDVVKDKAVTMVCMLFL